MKEVNPWLERIAIKHYGDQYIGHEAVINAALDQAFRLGQARTAARLSVFKTTARKISRMMGKPQ